MQITLFSFFSSVFWSSVLVVGIFLLRKTRRFRSGFGLTALVLLYLFSIFRILIPIELPHVMEWGIPDVYPAVYRFVTEQHLLWGVIPFHYGQLLLFIWALGSVFSLLRYALTYRSAMQSVRRYTQACGEREMHILEKVKQYTGVDRSVSLYVMPEIGVPCGTGLLHRLILLPHNSYTDQELFYILLHEYTHFIHHDILVKLLVSVFCCLFWWNPVVYLLKAHLEQTLEMKCDAAVVRCLEVSEKAFYLKTIVAVLKQCTPMKAEPRAAMALLRAERTLEIKERFDVVMYDATKPDRAFLQKALLCLSVCVFALSYAVLPQPEFAAPRSGKSGVIEFDSDTAYILQDEAQEYWLYIQDEAPIKLTKDAAAFYQQTGLTITKE